MIQYSVASPGRASKQPIDACQIVLLLDDLAALMIWKLTAFKASKTYQRSASLQLNKMNNRKRQIETWMKAQTVDSKSRLMKNQNRTRYTLKYEKETVTTEKD
jgi:hypothetical protein